MTSADSESYFRSDDSGNVSQNKFFKNHTVALNINDG
jgi:hypothetical protein